MNINSLEGVLQELRRLKPDLERQYGVTKIDIFDKSILKEKLEQIMLEEVS